jgi:diacylglycerol kinase family enzyme
VPESLPWIAIAVGVLVVLGLVVALARRPAPGRHVARPHRDEFREGPAPDRVRRAAVIVNPTKVTDTAVVRAHVAAVCAELGWAEPLYLETTPEDTGQGQTRQALAENVDVVCALGGDGTVRCVAEVLAGTTTPLALLPSGTGNLLARNMDIRLDDLDSAMRTALLGRNRHVDVGRLHVDSAGDGAEVTEHVFLVMAGMGFDAAVMADAPEDLKAKVGWPAYVVSGLRNLRGERFRASVSVGGGPVEHRRARTVVVGNCGRLLAGITLMPDAQIDDGILDSIVISPKTLAGWVAVSGRVMRQTTAANPRIDHWASTHFEVRVEHPQVIQLDGDVLRPARAMRAVVDAGSLAVRVP